MVIHKGNLSALHVKDVSKYSMTNGSEMLNLLTTHLYATHFQGRTVRSN